MKNWTKINKLKTRLKQIKAPKCYEKLKIKMTKAPFFIGGNFCTKFDALNNFFKRRTTHDFKA